MNIKTLMFYEIGGSILYSVHTKLQKYIQPILYRKPVLKKGFLKKKIQLLHILFIKMSEDEVNSSLSN